MMKRCALMGCWPAWPRFHPYLAPSGYSDPLNPMPNRTAEEIAAWRNRESAMRDLAELARQLEAWMASVVSGAA